MNNDGKGLLRLIMKMLFGRVGSQIGIADVCFRIVISIIIGSVIGLERERKNRPAGLRTHVLVCMAATLIAMVEQEMVYEISSLNSSNINLSFGRLSVGVITGIGFIGTGTIMMSQSKIIGLTTAASLLSIACLGLINGMGYSILALVASVLVILILQALKIAERKNFDRIIEVEFLNKSDCELAIENLLKEMNIRINGYSLSFHKKNDEKYWLAKYSVVITETEQIKKVISVISDLNDVTDVKIDNVI